MIPVVTHRRGAYAQHTCLCPGSRHVWYIQSQAQGLPHQRQQAIYGRPGKEEFWRQLPRQCLPPLCQISLRHHPCSHHPNTLAWPLGGSDSGPTSHSSHPMYYTHRRHTIYMQHTMHTHRSGHVQQVVCIHSTYVLCTHHIHTTHHRRDYILLLYTIHIAHDRHYVCPPHSHANMYTNTTYHMSPMYHTAYIHIPIYTPHTCYVTDHRETRNPRGMCETTHTYTSHTKCPSYHMPPTLCPYYIQMPHFIHHTQMLNT